MADPIGSWGTISLELPDFLSDIREAINSIAEVLITFLDIAIAALQLIKAFAFAFLDPLKAIIQAIIDTINALLRDFSQLGIYITHDAALLMADFPPEDLRGGFQEYERRMIARLTDRSDPTRPDISADTVVFAGFFYMSVDVSAIERLIAFVQQLLAMFSMKFFPEGSLPVPVVERVDYGNQAVGVFGGLSSLGSFSDTPPNKARVVWRTPQPSKKNPANPLSAFAGPSGYLITVSTIPEGIPVWFDRPEKDSGSEKTKRGSGPPEQQRETGRCRDVNGKPIVLYGGADEINFTASRLGWNNAVSGGKLKDGVPRVYGSLDKTEGQKAIIPLESLNEGGSNGTYFFQRTFYLPLSQVAWQWATQEFSIVLNLEDMPHHAEIEMGSDGKATLKDKGQPSTYYVRVASTSSKVADPGEKPFIWDFDAAAATSGQNSGEPFRVDLMFGNTPTSISAWSNPQKMVFPNGNTVNFLEAVQAALVVMVLARADLKTIDEMLETKGETYVALAKQHKELVPDVALVRTGMESVAQKLIKFMFPDFAQVMAEKPGSQMDFRANLARQAELLANRLRDTAGFTPEFEDFVVQASENLRTATWAQIFAGIGEDGISQGVGVFGKDTILDSVRGVKRRPNEDDVTLMELDVQELRLKLDLAELGVKGLTQTQIEKNLEALERQLAKAKETPPQGAGDAFGVAQNPYCIGLPAGDVDRLKGVRGIFRFRKPHFIEYDPLLVEKREYPAIIPPDQVAPFLVTIPPSMRAVYEKYILPDNSIELPDKVATLVEVMAGSGLVVGSADYSPVFHYGLDGMRKAIEEPVADFNVSASGILYVRSVLGAYQNGVILQEAATVLNMVAAAALRAPEDGEWIAIRFFDSFPAVDNFFEGIQNWLDQLAAAISSIVDTILAYIEFVEARLVELQQLIRRINALIQSILSFSLTLPKFSGLLLVADGTSGVLRGLITAQEKPFDSPLAYGAGVAIVMALVPGLAGQFLKSLLITTSGTSGVAGDGTDGQTIDVTGAADPFGLEGIPEPPPAQGPNDEPDVL